MKKEINNESNVILTQPAKSLNMSTKTSKGNPSSIHYAYPWAKPKPKIDKHTPLRATYDQETLSY
jgi:hypothetical protein